MVANKNKKLFKLQSGKTGHWLLYAMDNLASKYDILYFVV